MSKIGWIAAAAAVAIAATGCTRENDHLERKIDALATKIAAIDQKLSAGAGVTAKGGQQPQTQRPKRPEPDKASVFAVPIAGLPTRGGAAAPVTIVEGYEYACPACNMARDTVAKTLEKYGDKVRVVYKQFIIHPPVATEPARAVCAANKQGRFAEYQERVWAQAWRGEGQFDKEGVTQTALVALAGELGLDTARFQSDMSGPCAKSLADDQPILQRAGVTGTPTLVINDQRYQGPRSVEGLVAAVDAELQKAR